MVPVPNVESLGANMEPKPLSQADYLFQRDVVIGVAGLSEAVYARTLAGIEVKTTRRLEGVDSRATEGWD